MSEEFIKDQNALVMGDGKVYKIQKVRQRKIHSCVPCHQRKVKCSREHPVCQNCTKNNLECKYFVNDRVSRGKKKKDVDKEAELRKKQELKQYMARAKNLVSSSSTPISSTMGAEIPAEVIHQQQHQLQQPLQQHESHEPPHVHIGNDQPPHPQPLPPRPVGVNFSHQSPRDRTSLTFSDSESSVSIESLSPPNMHNPQVLPTEKHSNHTQQGARQHLHAPPPLPHTHNLQQQTQQEQPTQQEPTQQKQQQDHVGFLPPVNVSRSQTPSFEPQQQGGQPLSNSILSDFSLRQTPQPSMTGRLPQNEPIQQIALNLTNHSLPMILMPKQPEIVPTWKLEEIYSALPSRERSYGLVNRYITNIHPILPILDINEFVREHDAFWDNTLEHKLEFLVILFPVVYAASKGECFEFSYDEITKFELSNEIHKYLRIARVVFQTIGYPQKFSLRVLQSSVLLHSTLENPSLIDIGILVRIAQTVKLNRDPATFHKILDPNLVQTRRLLWWEIFYLDAMTALKNTSTPLIRLDEFDTSLPVEYVNNSLNPHTCFLNGKFRFTLILNELTRCMYGLNIVPFNTIQMLKQKILDLYISCNASIMNLENVESVQNMSYEQNTFIKWSKSVLSSYCDRALLLLQKKIVLSTVLNSNEEGNNMLIQGSFNQLLNSQRSKFSIEALMKSLNPPHLNTDNDLTHYTYDDLTNNLIPTSLHLLYEFLKNNNDDIYNGFNWEIRNNLPFDAIVLLLTNLISDLEKNQNNKKYELRNDIRYHLLDKTIDLIFIKFDNKKRSIIKNCFTLIRYLFQILRLKYLRNDSGNSTLVEFSPVYTEQIIPKPLNSSSNLLKRNTSSQKNQSLLNPTAISGRSNGSCFDEASNSFSSVSVSDMFVSGLTEEVNFFQSSNQLSTLGGSNENGSSGGDLITDDTYKEHEIQRIKTQITKFLREERLSDDDRFNNNFYIMVEHEIHDLIKRLTA
ncbi:unnamed protein product [Cyberlindnera jadinii]|uniref:Zn(2)-C6 fungal-type domain-containing protein n=1 Tax=Cyberlindnera jadinii (strain ATCC 18201 / CBS 1600 / BCRC 20928 / JCM 3617 / NBRC 0987 / NRRL Y-1542) TaxID=983966 RepID=A0A0H5C1Q6_CYBJN|nr:unnamed protein product [Cyberlindnera jadinii]